MRFDVSIVILTHDSLGVVERLVDALLAQEFEGSFEVIFMDNASTDGTPDYLEATPFEDKQVVHVARGEFSHSRTRMRAAELAQGEIVVFFVDDIVPLGPHFLHELTRPVREGAAPAAYGVFQVDAATCDPIDAYVNNGWWEHFDDVVGPVSEYCWRWLPPEARRRVCNFDNCASCIRRDLLLELRFPDVPYGEDMTLAKRLHWTGHKIALAKEARFYHWHRSSFSYVMKRMCIDQELTKREFGHLHIKRKLGVVRAVTIRVAHRIGIALFQIDGPLRRRLYWAGYNAKVLTADFVGKYLGSLEEGAIGRFSWIDRRLYRLKREILDEVEARSVKRY